MEGGVLQQRKLEKASKDFVFVWQHQTQADSKDSYKVITEEYFEEDFFHPAYLFIRPDLTEADPANRHHHESVSAQFILKTLRKIQKEWGKGLSEKDAEKPMAELASVEQPAAVGNWEVALPVLEKLAKLKARCGIRERAKRLLRLKEVGDELREGWNPFVAKFGRAVSRKAGDAIRKSQLVWLYRIVEGETAPEGMEKEWAAYRDQVVAAMRETIRLRPVTMQKVFLSTGSYRYLRAVWQTDLPEFPGLVAHLAFLTSHPKTIEGHAVYDDVKQHLHHRAALSITTRDLRLRKITNLRVQLWIDGLLLHESLLNESPTEFPEDTSNVKVGPALLEEQDSLGVWTHSRVRDYRLGRYKGTIE
jgi:hypothetical protein